MTEEVKNEVQEQVIAMEEDGRLGNLLIETATLLLIGRMANVSVSLLPQVAAKLSPLLAPLPLAPVDHRRHCLCTKCTDCLCPECRRWKKVPYWTYLKNPSQFTDPYILIQWFHSDLVLRHVGQLAREWRPLLDRWLEAPWSPCPGRG